MRREKVAMKMSTRVKHKNMEWNNTELSIETILKISERIYNKLVENQLYSSHYGW